MKNLNTSILLVFLSTFGTSPVGASDLRLSVTESLLTEYRGDNGNPLDDDDNYGIIFNRLNFQGSAGDLSASHRLDLIQFIAAPSDRFVDEFRPERITLRYEPGDWRFLAGDFHRQLGRGIILSLRKVDELGLDVSLRGGEAGYWGDNFEVTAFSGVVNSVNIDSVSQQHVGDPHDLMAGGVVDFSATDWLRFSAFGLYAEPRDQILQDHRDTSLSGGASAEMSLLDDSLVVYVEGDVQHRETAGAEELGYAGYVAIDALFGDLTFLFEGLVLSAFEQRGSMNEALNTRFTYNLPPTLERVDQEVLNSRDVAGGRLRVEGVLLDGDLRIHGNMMFRMTDPDKVSRVDQIHVFSGAEYLWDYGASRAAVSGGYRHELQLGRDIKTMGHFEADYLNSITERLFIHITTLNEFRTQAGTPYERGSLFLGVEYARLGGLTFEFGYDTQNQSADARNFFYAGILAWEMTDRFQLRATGGSQRGGLKCVAGVCRIFPEFTGGRIELIGRF